MKVIKMMIIAAACALALSACKSSTCPGYGGVQRNYGEVVKAQVENLA